MWVLLEILENQSTFLDWKWYDIIVYLSNQPRMFVLKCSLFFDNEYVLESASNYSCHMFLVILFVSNFLFPGLPF